MNAQSNLSSSPLHAEVYDRLSKSLMRGEFKPGQKLTLRKLAAFLNVSMTPVREAVRQLSAYGALEIIPKKHILVTPLTAEKYMEIVEIRKLLEGHAAARASKRITTSEIEKITSINQKILGYAKKNNFKKAMEENQKFHFEIYKIADSKTLLESIETQWLKIGPSLSYYLYGEGTNASANPTEGFDTHMGLIKALKEKDPNSALKAMTQILETAANQLFQSLRHQTDLSLSTLDEIWTTEKGNK